MMKIKKKNIPMTIVVKNCSNCLMNEQMANVLFPRRKMWLWLRIGPYFFSLSLLSVSPCVIFLCLYCSRLRLFYRVGDFRSTLLVNIHSTIWSIFSIYLLKHQLPRLQESLQTSLLIPQSLYR